ncbi:hypothetical protein GXP67_30970 [Rhodocytophaga rosea]|uniref:Uncharacterized protein n=1 Tax=Rhodocytophaga rosea TaxID=2704465 RepID=A0A6C0GS42_9BACT|nr:hypothetical protein [Rhodocytophaga rosea]QHT70757.1 hypothetical protein GXP67_30970 [Rhodocytophaga rosea]
MKEQLGERLTELREDLSKRTGEKWPMGKVAQATGITQNMIERIEGARVVRWKLTWLCLIFITVKAIT